MQIGIHCTPKKNCKKIKQKGITPQPFWKSQEPLRFPLKFRFIYQQKANILTGKTHAQITDSIYDSLKAANYHLTKSAQSPFQLRELSLFLVDIDNSKIGQKRQKTFFVRTTKSKKDAHRGSILEEVHLRAPKNAVTEITLTEKEIAAIEEETKCMNWFDANKHVAQKIADKIVTLIKVP
jgi:hypothetical protein